MEKPSFKLIGGDPALDFVNTASWGPSHEILGDEKLHEYEDLIRWAREAGVLTDIEAGRLGRAARRRRAQAARVLERACDLRWALQVIVLDTAAGRSPPPDHLRVLEDELARTPMRLAQSEDGGLDWTWNNEDPNELDRPLWRIVWHALDLLRAPEAIKRVRSCASDACGWVFLDVSRRGNRKWCDMADCGNRAKARRHYRRHYQPPAASHQLRRRDRQLDRRAV